MHSKPIASINQGRSADRFLDKKLKEMGFAQIESFDAPLADYAAIIGLQRSKICNIGDASSSYPHDLLIAPLFSTCLKHLL